MTTVEVTPTRILVRAPFSMSGALRLVGGARWAPDLRAWTYPIAAAAALRKVVPDPALDRLAAPPKTDAIDGLQTALWAHQRRALEFALARPASMLALDMGCIDGAATILVNRAGISRRMTLREAYVKWNAGNWRAQWYCRSLMGDRFGQNLIRDIRNMGSKSVLRLELTDGKVLRLTPDHEVLCDGGQWTRADELKPGVAVYVNGAAVRICEDCGDRRPLPPSEAMRVIPRRCRSCSFKHRVGELNSNWRGGLPFVDADGYVRVTAKDHPRANRSGHVYQHILVAEKMLGRSIGPAEHVHHKNEDKADNRPENLEVLSKAEHMRQHDVVLRLDGGSTLHGGRVVFVPKLAKVASVAPDGEADVYDLVMTDPHRNFVASGVVVHNCGKSAVTVAAALAWGCQRILISCPLSVVGVWPREFERHSSILWRVIRLDRGTVAEKAAATRLAMKEGGHLAVVINHESIWREPFRELARATPWDLLVVDESHRAKSPGGKLSRFLASLSHVPRRLALTGTPLPHSPLDAYGQFRFLDSSVFGTSFVRFRSRYARMGGFGQHQVIGWQNMEEYDERLSRLAIRIKKAAAIDLPPELDVERRCQLEPEASRIYKQIERDFCALVSQGLVTASNALVQLLRLQQIAGGFLRVDESEDKPAETVSVSEAKTKLLADVLEDLDEPVVVFARFVTDLGRIREVAEKLGRRYGEISGATKDGLTPQATMREDVDVLGVQIQSGGVGIDLVRASTAIYYSHGWSLGDLLQSRARLHRPGQTRPVTYIHLLAERTVDEWLMKALANREELVETVLRRLA